MLGKVKSKLRIEEIFAFLLGLFHFWTGYSGGLGAMNQRVVHLGLAASLVLLVSPMVKKSCGEHRGIKLFNYGACIVLLFFSLYLWLSYEAIVYRRLNPTVLDIVAGSVVLFLVFEMGRRKLGLALPIIACIFVIYAFVGPYVPKVIAHKGYSYSRMVSYLSLSLSGVFGIPLGLSATVIAQFILFGSFLNVSKGGDFFISLATCLVGRVRGGAAKAAVVASSLFGSISGSPVANVVATGSITIPTMKALGYRPLLAGATEAVASTGGNLMPPVMGAAAFIMAEFLAVPYVAIIKAAIIPAILYYIVLFFSIDFEAAKMKLKGLPKEQIPSLKKVIKQGWFHLSPIATLLYFLIILQWSPMTSAFYATLIVIIILFITKIVQEGVKSGFSSACSDFIAALRMGGKAMTTIAAATAVAGIVVGVISLTGLGYRLTSVLLNISGGSIPALLFLVMLCAILLSMGVNTSAAYIVVAVMLAPALVEVGIAPIAAHFFTFYFALLSVITPPVAVAAYAAAGISGADPWETGWMAMRLGVAGFVIPFVFVFNPALLALGESAKILGALITAILGGICLASGLNGYLFSQLFLVQRITIVLAGVLLVIPGRYSDLIGAFLICLILFDYYLRKKRTKGRLVSD